MKLLNLFGLGDTSMLLTVALNRLGIDTDLLLSNKMFKTHLPSWMRDFPELENHTYVWQAEDAMDFQTVRQLGKFCNRYDHIIAHAPAAVYHHLFKKPFSIWDGGSSHFLWNNIKLSIDAIQYDKEAARRGYYRAKHILCNDINVYYEWLPKNLVERATPIPLPVDCDTFKPMNLRHYDHRFVVYFPTRQISELKGIRPILEGFKAFTEEVDETIMFVSKYGRDVPYTRYLIEHLGLQKHAEFIDIVPKQQFAQNLNKADVIIDQIIVGAIGGVTVQAMACEKPVIVNANQKWYKKHYEEVPIFNAVDSVGVFDALRIAYIFRNAGTMKLSRKFILKYHEYNKVAERLVEVIEQ